MKAVFNDLQNDSSRLHGTTVYDRKELFALLECIRDRQPFGCELVSENDSKLTFGIGKNIGFVQHSPANGDTPYLLAVASEKCCEGEFVEFLVGDTATPIPQRFCLPFVAIMEIAAYFIETGERSPAVSWEEV